ncbi:MAG: trehalase-like domain-containing protein [Chthoniobacterales bacterium]
MLPRLPDFPIKDHGMIGNCETAALVNSRGGIDWLCLPAFDGGFFFGAPLDREKGGEFVIEPAANCEATQRYLDDSAILETCFATSGVVVVATGFRDFTSLRNAGNIRADHANRDPSLSGKIRSPGSAQTGCLSSVLERGIVVFILNQPAEERVVVRRSPRRVCRRASGRRGARRLLSAARSSPRPRGSLRAAEAVSRKEPTKTDRQVCLDSWQ